MGIEQFFGGLKEYLPSLGNVNIIHKAKPKPKYFFIDFNSIIHITSSKTVNEINELIQDYYMNNKSMETSNNELYNKYKSKYGIINFGDKISKSQIDKCIIKETLNKLKEIILKDIIPTDLLEIYIGIDGVPSKAKIVEQQKRRYMGYIVDQTKKNIFDKYKNEIAATNESRYIYEINRISWLKGNISPGTDFMYKLHQELNSVGFELELKTLCPTLQKYILSGVTTYGEGEFKIMKEIYNNYSDKKYLTDITVYSPDSDMTVLLLILIADINKKYKILLNIDILRHNQQENNYDTINITNLRYVIGEYVANEINIKNNIIIDDIIRDITFLMSVFGNDFIPKIESINARNNFMDILNIYIQFKNTIPENIIIYSTNLNKYIINYNNLTIIFELFSKIEYTNLQINNLSKKYSNFNKLKKSFITSESTNIVENIDTFFKDYNTFNKYITGKITKDIFESTISNCFVSILKKYININVVNLNDADIIIQCLEYYNKNKKLPELKLHFMSYSSSLNSAFNKKRFSDHLIKNNINKQTKYDVESYSFENKYDSYHKLLNCNSANIANVIINCDHYKNTYNIIKESEKISYDKYYQVFFNINKIDIINKKINELVYEYLMAIHWVFEYYYNNMDNTNYIYNMYYYKHSRAPLIKQIYEFMNSTTIDTFQYMFQKISDNNIKSTDYYNSLEHLILVTPTELISTYLPDDILKMINTPAKSIKYIADNISNKIYDPELIDCRDTIYLNKCHINVKPTYTDTKEVIIDLKNIDYDISKRGIIKDNDDNTYIYLPIITL